MLDVGIHVLDVWVRVFGAAALATEVLLSVRFRVQKRTHCIAIILGRVWVTVGILHTGVGVLGEDPDL
jgi:hypothetical protein